MVEGLRAYGVDEIAANMKLEKRLCHDAPFYVLPAAGHRHRAGRPHHGRHRGAVAAASGADFRYVTPAEHLRSPDAADVQGGPANKASPRMRPTSRAGA